MGLQCKARSHRHVLPKITDFSNTMFSTRLPVHLPSLCCLCGYPSNPISMFRAFPRLLPRIPARAAPRISPAECTVGHVYALVCICATVHQCRFLHDSTPVCMSMCMFVCPCVSLIRREFAGHSRGTLHCSVHELHRTARARRRLSTAEQQQNRPGKEPPAAQALNCNLLYLQPSFSCPCKAHTPLLLISCPSKDGLTPVWILS